jgi:hypothetical protein
MITYQTVTCCMRANLSISVHIPRLILMNLYNKFRCLIVSFVKKLFDLYFHISYQFYFVTQEVLFYI